MTEQPANPDLEAACEALEEIYPAGFMLVAKTSVLEGVGPPAIGVHMPNSSPVDLLGMALLLFNQVLRATGQPVVVAPAQVQPMPKPGIVKP